MFRESDYGWLKIIGCLKDSGLQLKEIRDFINMAMQGDETIAARLELFRRRREAIKEQMEELQQTLDVVDFKCWYYETALEAGTTAAPDNMPDEDLPPAPARDTHAGRCAGLRARARGDLPPRQREIRKRMKHE